MDEYVWKGPGYYGHNEKGLVYVCQYVTDQEMLKHAKHNAGVMTVRYYTAPNTLGSFWQGIK